MLTRYQVACVGTPTNVTRLHISQWADSPNDGATALDYRILDSKAGTGASVKMLRSLRGLNS